MNLQELRVGVIEEFNFNLILKEWEGSYHQDKKEKRREREHPVTLGDDGVKACTGRRGQSSSALLENLFFIWWEMNDFSRRSLVSVVFYGSLVEYRYMTLGI